jgi:hypothetical protein
MSDDKQPWETPHITSVAVPEIESLLADAYRKQATRWGEAARKRREQATPDSDDAE